MKLSLPSLHTEWRDVIDAWQLDSWEAYRDVARLGRNGNVEDRGGRSQVAAVAAWLAKRKAEGVAGRGITCS